MAHSELYKPVLEYSPEREASAQSFKLVRQQTESICENLKIEDYVVQANTQVSPPKWHLAHTTWFFELFVLREFDSSYQPINPIYDYLFNSYYESIGESFERSQRGILSRPSVEEVYDYRSHINHAIDELFDKIQFQGDTLRAEKIRYRIELGMQHEQQHQELLLSDIKYNFWKNPLRPELFKTYPQENLAPRPLKRDWKAMDWLYFPGGLESIGHDGTLGFAFDNEHPVHSVFIQPFHFSSRLVTNGEYMEFMEWGGYKRHELWLSEGWKWVRENHLSHPLYWEGEGNHWQVMTLSGMKPWQENEPIRHLSYYEADAYARWRGKRLPTEEEWEYVALRNKDIKQFNRLWEWTQSAYLPYPGFKPWVGPLGEYNGKFMCNQMVLRGGSFATPQGHSRPSYRNYYSPDSQWQFSGLRLASSE